ncbi:peptidase S8 and S53 [Ectocarpus siliculosus]|uniref:subtilisin n=1 Tax=Ectocarpus siliculosus TaxID=2880 RepID=D8LQI1_ECTSI|nr:peptidase S8 and S53 [Ectocarpus siliculosus]|eukprot:CBN78745.1 peptidase S8 and S53 [Ectocarpus siliculosus]
MRVTFRGAATSVLLISTVSGASQVPSLGFFEQTLLTTAGADFDSEAAFAFASAWQAGDRQGRSSPYLSCVEHGEGRHAYRKLEGFLGARAVKPVSSTATHGACFMVTASPAEAAQLSSWEDFTTFGAFPAALKIAPGLLDHGSCDGPAAARDAATTTSDCSAGRLSTTHGASMQVDSAHGLMVELSPGTLPSHSGGDAKAHEFIQELLKSLSSPSLDLHAITCWSDLVMKGGDHLFSAAGALRGREWSRAATLVNERSESEQETPSQVCGWEQVVVHHAANDVLLVAGLDHLLYDGREVSGASEEEAAELRMACYMGLVSFLASRHEVLKVAGWNRKVNLNAAARATIQSASVDSTPLTDAGLDGSGEVIQIIDAGVNETTCFLEHGDGTEVEHGYYFDFVASSNPLFTSSSESRSMFKAEFTGGDFSYDSDRRKVIQYIDLINPDTGDGSSSGMPFVSADSFVSDDDLGHGTHAATTVAGSTISSPAELVSCADGSEVIGCAGGCITESSTGSSEADYGEDINRLCPAFGCSGDQCLPDDTADTLSEHGGMAQGAKIAAIDVFYGDYSYGDLAGNGLWETCADAGCKIHSNSYGVDLRCQLTALDVLYDEYMYENQEHLLLFSAGNTGWTTDRDTCTIDSPGIAKNVLTVGSTSSGVTRLSTTDLDGRGYADGDELSTIDVVSEFSGYGFTEDGRIKPEVVAPGDMIYSASGNGGDSSCELIAYAGTSFSTAVASGAAAMVRQYFRDSSFYSADVESRGFCDQGFTCDSFSPMATTVKAMLINSANVMGGGNEPDTERGFGRIHLEAGMPLGGAGDMALFVADSSDHEVYSDEKLKFYFNVDPDAGMELRATLSWNDPAASSLSGDQLVNDLDLRVYAPDGTRYCMWDDNCWDTSNVNERVIVPAEVVAQFSATDEWEVRVRGRDFTVGDTVSFSLVVTGAISPPIEGNSAVVAAAVGDDSSAADDDATGAAVTMYGRGAGAGSGFVLAGVAMLAAALAAAV